MSRPLSWYTGGGGGGAAAAARDGPVSTRYSFVADGLPELKLDESTVSRGAVQVVAVSPTGSKFPMDVNDIDGIFSTNFMPTEIGQYTTGNLLSGTDRAAFRRRRPFRLMSISRFILIRQAARLYATNNVNNRSRRFLEDFLSNLVS